MTFEVERPQDFAARAAADSGDMFLTTFGTDVIFYENAASFSSSDDSLLIEDGSDPDLPRIGAESYLSFGGAGGVLHGTVLSARVLTNVLTGQPFATVTVRSAGFSLEVCLPWSADMPAPSVGSLIGGDVYLIATLPGPPSWTTWNVAPGSLRVSPSCMRHETNQLRWEPTLLFGSGERSGIELPDEPDARRRRHLAEKHAWERFVLSAHDLS